MDNKELIDRALKRKGLGDEYFTEKDKELLAEAYTTE